MFRKALRTGCYAEAQSRECTLRVRRGTVTFQGEGQPAGALLAAVAGAAALVGAVCGAGCQLCGSPGQAMGQGCSRAGGPGPGRG